MTKEMLLKKLSEGKLKKVRSKMIREALEKGLSENGNHRADLVSFTDQATFSIYYRGTVIAEAILLETGTACIPIGAGEFENTPSTMRQRKELMEALDEIADVLYKAVS